MSYSLKKIEDVLENKQLIVFDGVCNLCNQSVQFVIKKEVKNIFLFAPLQNLEVQAYIYQQNPKLSTTDSILLITQKKIYTKSSAALRIAKHLKGWYSLTYLFYMVPKPIRDVVYDFIAARRYRWFGKQTYCWTPTPEIKSKFL